MIGDIGLRLRLVLLFVLLSSAAIAQPMRRPMYGVGDDEFMIGAWVHYQAHAHYTDTAGFVHRITPTDNLWDFLHSLDIDVARMQAHQWGGMDTMHAMIRTRTSERDRIIVSHLYHTPTNTAVFEGGNAREALMYPFDSARFDNVQYRFTRFRRDGPVRTNPVERNDFGDPAGERYIGSAYGDTAGALIAGGMSFNWNPLQVNRYRIVGNVANTSESVQNSSDYLAINRGSVIRNQFGMRPDYIAVRGRLLDVTYENSDAPVLRVEVWHEVPKGESYSDRSGAHKADTNVERLCHTVLVRARDLVSGGDASSMTRGATVSYRYGEHSYAVDLKQCDDGSDGPDGRATSSRRFDIRVYWLGSVPIALRSVAIRDQYAGMLLGDVPGSEVHRNAIREMVRESVYGPGWRDSAAANPSFLRDSVKRSIIAIGAGAEQDPFDQVPYAAMQRIIREIADPSDTNSRLPAWTEDGDQRSLFQVDSNQESATAEYMIIAHEPWLSSVLRTPYAVPPAVREHNGGRFKTPGIGGHEVNGIPELEIDADDDDFDENVSRIEDFETTMQRIGLGGQYVPYRWDLPEPYLSRSNLLRVGRAAEAARDHNVRMTLILFNTSVLFGFRELVNSSGDVVLDTHVTRIPEASEIRAMMNMGLAYGATGVIHQVLTSATNVVSRTPTAHGNYVGVIDFGMAGQGTRDTTRDWYARLPIYSPGDDYHYQNAPVRYYLPSVFLGWGTRTRETRRLNRWLRRVGPELVKLRWRDAYSMHFAVPQEYTVPAYDRDIDGDWYTVRELEFRPRPLPADEIVTDVTARSIETGRVDDARRTYVELGFFEPLPAGASASGVAKKTHHVFVVNRRTFERGDDSASGVDSGRVRMMDRLAETREITLHLNLGGSDRVVRVTEIEPDVAPVPGSSEERVPLDVIVQANGTIPVLLGPGRGTLLRIEEEG